MSNHTPGPWKHKGTLIINPQSPLLKPHDTGIGGQIAEVTGLGNENHATQIANAIIITAAPELLFALKIAINLLNTNNTDGRYAYAVALAAIDQATKE